MLTIPEELLLLALDDDKGTVVPAAWNSLNYGLAGAILADLAIRDKITLENKKIIVIDNDKTEEPLLDETLDRILSTTRSRSAKRWIESMALRSHGIKKELLKRFVHKGILRQEQKKFLWVFNRPTYFAEQERYEKEIRSRISTSLFEDKALDSRTAILLSLIKACSLINEIFPKDERKPAKAMIDDIAKGEQYGKAVTDTITALQAGIVAATSAAAAASAAGAGGGGGA